MKKLMCIFLTCLLLTGCNTPKKTIDKVSFTNPVQLETTVADMSGYTYLTDTDLCFEEITFQESLRMWSENGTGILFYGMPGCYWCQRAVPSINQAATKLGVKVYYINLSNGVDEATYDKFLEYADSILPTNADGEKSFSFPEVIAIKEGKIVGDHLSVVSSYDPDTQEYLSDEQVEELVGIYSDLFILLNE